MYSGFGLNVEFQTKLGPRFFTLLGSRWLCGNALASDANGPGSTPGGTLKLDTGYHPFVGR